MRFDCSACGTVHEFPDEEIPAEGITVACTNCGLHIALKPQGPSAGALAEVEEIEEIFTAEEPPLTATATGEALRLEKPEAQAPLGRSSADPQPPVGRAQAPAFGTQPPAQAPAGPPVDIEEAPEPADQPGRKKGQKAVVRIADEASGEGETIPWRQLPRMFLSLVNVRRLAAITVGFWGALVVFGLVQWLGHLMAKMWQPLGSLMDAVAWIAFGVGGALVAGVAGYSLHQELIEGRRAGLKESLGWVKAHLKGALGVPLLFIALLVGCALAIGVVGFVGRTPGVGPIVWGIVSPALFALSLAAGIIGLIFVCSLPLYIPLILQHGEGPVETLVRLGDLFSKRGVGLGLQLFASILLTVLGFIFVALPVLISSKYIFMKASQGGMGEQFMRTLMSVPPGLSGLEGSLMAGFGASGDFDHKVGGFFLGLGSQLPTALLLASFVIVYFAAGTRIYAHLKDRAEG